MKNFIVNENIKDKFMSCSKSPHLNQIDTAL